MSTDATAWVIESSRLGFRRLRQGDLAALRPILGDIETMYAWEYGFDDTQIVEWISRAIERYASDNGCAYHAAINKETDELVGLVGLMQEEIDGARHLGVGYILAKKHWGRGYATEGARAWIDFAFEKMGVAEVVADIRPENGSSVAVAERLGMTRAGQHVKHHNGKAMPHDVYTIRRRQGAGS